MSIDPRTDVGLRDPDAERGWRDYNRPLLAVYDRIVIGVIAKAVWRCPPERLRALYRANIRAPHLDVGPGTGYAIDRSGLPDGSAVTILDPNPTVLDYATRRLRRFDVTAVRASVLEPLPILPGFPSAGLNVVLHCLPGPMARKAAAIRNIAAVLAPDGVLFGSTVLGLAGDQTRLSRAVLRLFNGRGAFDNLGDSEADLRAILEEFFEDVDISVVGAIAIFVARRPSAVKPAAATGP